MARKNPYFTACTRTVTRPERTGKMNIVTGETTFGEWKDVTGPCNVPLFGTEERITGVCRSCRKAERDAKEGRKMRPGAAQ
jgi:hypothetical protein